MTGSLSLAVRAKEDVLWAKQEAKRFAATMPFSADDLARIEISLSELASNMIKHAGGGRLSIQRIERDGREGVRVIAKDHGPGIPNLDAALKAGFSTSGSLGVGLSGIHEHMDKVQIETRPGEGTCVEAEKWVT